MANDQLLRVEVLQFASSVSGVLSAIMLAGHVFDNRTLWSAKIEDGVESTLREPVLVKGFREICSPGLDGLT